MSAAALKKGFYVVPAPDKPKSKIVKKKKAPKKRKPAQRKTVTRVRNGESLYFTKLTCDKNEKLELMNVCPQHSGKVTIDLLHIKKGGTFATNMIPGADLRIKKLKQDAGALYLTHK